MTALWERLKGAFAALAGREPPAPSPQSQRILALPQSAGAAQSFAAQPERYRVRQSEGGGYTPPNWAGTQAESGLSPALPPALVDAAALDDALCAHYRRRAGDIALQEVL